MYNFNPTNKYNDVWDKLQANFFKYTKIHEIDGQENLPHDDTIIFANDAHITHYILMLIKLNNIIYHMKIIQLPKTKKNI